MLKFFRQYNKHILVVGGCLLMISFLIEPALNKCQQSYHEETIGRLDGGKVTTTDIRIASTEMGVLNALSPIFRLLNEEQYEPLQWILILHDAKKMGLSSSKREAQEVIETSGISNLAINEAMRQYGVTADEVVHAVRNWSIVQQYEAIAQGAIVESTAEQLKRMEQRLAIMLRFGVNIPAPAPPTPVSEPMVRRSVYDQRAEVSITGVEVPAINYLTEIKPPTEEEVKALYEQNKDKLPGEGEHGFGYKYPNRVKLEYLRFPYERAKAFVQVEEVDAYAHYERNKDRFIIPATPAPIPEPVPTPLPAPTPKPDEKTPPKTPPKTDEKAPPKTDEKAPPKADDKTAPKTDEKTKTPEKSKAGEKPKVEEKPKADEKKDGCAPGDDTPAAKDAAPKTDAAKDAAPKADAAKDAAPKAVAPKADAPKTDAPKAEAPKADPPKADVPKTDTPPTIAPRREDPLLNVPPFVPGPPRYRPYEDVREEIIRDLKEIKARELVRKMVLDAQEMLLREVRRLPQHDGYYDTKGYKPGLLVDIATDLQKRYKLLPTVVRLDADWLDQAAVRRLPEFGDAVVSAPQTQVRVTIDEYVFSAKELLGKDSKHRLMPLRLQVGVPNIAPAEDLSSMYLFRVTDAKPAYVPAYADRRDDVERDTRKLAAYKILQGKREELLKRARTEKIEDIAKALGATVFSPRFRKLEMDFFGGSMSVPKVEPIGESEAFVEYVFDAAEKALKEGSLEGVGQADRSGAIAVDKRLSMVLFRVDLFKPVTRAELETDVASPNAGGMVARSLVTLRDQASRPMSIESLSKRTGYVPEHEEKQDAEKNEAENKEPKTTASK